jgi:hypothetical protein
MIDIRKTSNLKTSKGYRLKNSTHSMIERIQLITNGSKDTVISRAVKLYYNEINNMGKASVTESKTLHKKHK